jgi:multiple sugar transport system permease protein
VLPWAAIAPFLLPFAWMIVTSLKDQAENLNYPPTLIFRPTWQNYVDVFRENPLTQYFVNSLIIGAGSTALALGLGTPAAYTIARWRQRRLAVLLLTARLMPGVACLVPWYMVFRSLGMLDTYGALILTHLIVSLPIVVWLLIGFFEDVPTELEDAGRIDGCSNWQAFSAIALPLVRPGLVAAAILAFIYSWNNFLFSLILAGERTAPLPVAVFSFITYGMINWGGLTAAATVILVPVLILTLVIQRHIVRGLTAGATKG